MDQDKLLDTKNLMELVKNNPQKLEKMVVQGAFPEEVSLTAYLNELLEQKSLTMSDVVHTSLLSKSYVYQVFSGERTPFRDTLLRIGIAMSCTVDEIQRLLTLGQMGILYPKVRRDVAILCCISQGLSLMETDEFLTEIDERSLL